MIQGKLHTISFHHNVVKHPCTEETQWYNNMVQTHITYKTKLAKSDGDGTENGPDDARPVRNLLSSPDNAEIAASICEVALASIVSPMSGNSSTVFPIDSSPKNGKNRNK